MGNYKQGILFISFICLGVTAAVLVKSDPFVRLIPADVLRGQYYLIINSAILSREEKITLLGGG